MRGATALVPATEEFIRSGGLYVAFAHLQVAVIAAGIDHRRSEGSGSGPGSETAGQAVLPFLEAGLEAIGGVR